MTTTETNHPGAEDPSSPPEPENRDGAAETPEGASRADERTVDLPRFRGFQIPALDRTIIMVLPPLLIVGVVIAVILAPDASANLISNLRSVVTGGFTWWFVLYSLIAVAVCVWLCISPLGRIRLGGPKARPAHGNFAWYSMLFACGQGVGLIFWSLAEPMMLRDGAPVASDMGNAGQSGIIWTYFHWGPTAWAMYCVVAICLAYSHHNLGKTLTFREATVDILPSAVRRPAGVVIELLAIIATVLGLATSFGFAAMQFSSGLNAFTWVASGPLVWMIVIVVLGTLTAISAFMGVNKGMKRISELNSVLSIVLVVGVFVFGPTIFILSNMFQTFGGFIASFPAMSFWTEAETAGSGAPWDELWNGPWTVFIWCWVIAFSPFVAGFIARISRGRTLREFVLGVTIVPSLIVMVWTAVIASAGIRYDDQNGLVISEAVNEDLSVVLFRMLEMVPGIGILLLIMATVLVATYYVTSLDSGTYALAEFVSAPKKSGPAFRVVLVISIATVAAVLLSLGGAAVVDTVQTGTIIGAFPFSFVIILMIANLIRRLRSRNAAVVRTEREINDPEPRPEDEFVDEDGIPDPRRGVGEGTFVPPQTIRRHDDRRDDYR